jgi:translocation and assembly module TamB
VRARKNANEPLLLIGAIETVRGWYSLYGRKFRLEHGIIRFTGATSIDPSLDVVAQYTLPKYRVEVVVSGTAREPSLSLRSEPALEQADILSLLIFGKPANALNAGEKSSLQSQALHTAAGYIASDLRRALASELGLDNLEFDLGQTLEQSRIGAGTYVTRDIFVSTSQPLQDKHGREFSLEYSLDENWQIKVITTTHGNSGADLVWQKRY